MGFTVSQDLTAKFTATLQKKFGEQATRKGVEAMGATAVELIKVRTNNGIDVDGKPFTPYSKDKKGVPRYENYKRRYISGKVKKKAGSSKWAARSVNDFMRLSGDLFDDIDYKVTKFSQPRIGLFTMNFKLYIKPRSAPKAHGLIKKRKFFGIATSGIQKFKEQNALINAFKRATKLQGFGTIS